MSPIRGDMSTAVCAWQSPRIEERTRCFSQSQYETWAEAIWLSLLFSQISDDGQLHLVVVEGRVHHVKPEHHHHQPQQEMQEKPLADVERWLGPNLAYETG